ncbi:MAG TPA: transposase [Candidatus Competibacteraceae bacterium]|nr:transposase [Candidatus Competibacteraceae bacterium]HQA24934.1 transposase [Candidatus Competibacteraceae bacterium]HQD56019.1 transposase [Candidatus Competibacteraceae bacterium]
MTAWFDEIALTQWYEAEKTGYGDHRNTCANLAIQCVLTIRAVFHLLLRAPDYSTLSCRG